MEINNLTSDDGRGEKTTCDRCAGCCTGGGPVLRKADAHLVMNGKIPSALLYTIRKGERLFDRDKMKMVPVATDMIKIKIDKDTFACRFLENENHCTVYNTRPAECRAFKCWDTKQIEAKYDEIPLERQELLGAVEGLWELIADHQERCDYERVGRLAEEIKSEDSEKALEQLKEVIGYDISLRETLVEKANVDPEMLSFLLGRPFTETLVMFDLKVEKSDGLLVIKPVS